jgi:YfiH family protein
MMIRSTALARLPGVVHAFFTREGGISEGVYATLNGGQGSNDKPEHVRENRARMAKALGVAPERIVTAYQIHSSEAVVVEKPWARESRPRADAIVSKTPGLALGVTVADCGPILLADAEARVVGAVHAGWKGGLAGVLEAAVAKMEELGAERSRMFAALGPLIRQENYEVGPEFVARFRAADKAYARFFTTATKPGHALFDLPGFLLARLANAGVHLVEDLGLDTYADEARFFSYRRSQHRKEPDYGRLMGAIALAP